MNRRFPPISRFRLQDSLCGAPGAGKEIQDYGVRVLPLVLQEVFDKPHGLRKRKDLVVSEEFFDLSRAFLSVRTVEDRKWLCSPAQRHLRREGTGLYRSQTTPSEVLLITSSLSSRAWNGSFFPLPICFSGHISSPSNGIAYLRFFSLVHTRGRERLGIIWTSRFVLFIAKLIEAQNLRIGWEADEVDGGLLAGVAQHIFVQSDHVLYFRAPAVNLLPYCDPGGYEILFAEYFSSSVSCR